MEPVLSKELNRLHGEFNHKLTKLQTSYFAQIETMEKSPESKPQKTYEDAKSAIQKILQEKRDHCESEIVQPAKRDFDSLTASTSHNHSHATHHQTDSHDSLLKICDHVTEKYWMLAGEVDNEIRTVMAEAQLPVKHPFDYEDIKRSLTSAKLFLYDAIADLSRAEMMGGMEYWIRQLNEHAESFRSPAEDIKARINMWKTMLTERVKAIHGNEVIPFLSTEMNKRIDASLEEIDKYVRHEIGETDQLNCGVRAYSDASSVDTSCLERRAERHQSELVDKIHKIASFILFFNQELEAIGQ